MQNEELIKAARELSEKATPGPWHWDVATANKSVDLENRRDKVMDFTRYGMNGAAPRFNVDGIMERADKLAKSIPGMEHHHGFDDYINHPDAEFIAASRALVPQLADALEAADKAQRWIPVGERLPTEIEYRNGDKFKSLDSNELVPLLVCCEDTEIPFRAFYDGKNWGDGWAKLDVTHWQKLPQPPEKG